MWSTSCNIQHLTQQQSQLKIQWSILRKRTFHHFQQANTATWPSYTHDDVIKQIMARAAWRRKGSEHWEHCAAYRLQRSSVWRKDEKRTFWAMKRRRNGSRIMWIQKPLLQECELMTQRQQLCNTRKIWEMPKRRDQQPESLKKHLRRCYMLSETVWLILKVPMMRRMRKTRPMMKKI